ncbi:HD domain-containing protein [Erysipelotrichaceae bacterium OttesenSCG-928-M19]|nr:HD domain-containing protein [Erysipelotrichaceae bacterium OttesenSCG-928-M19]
MNDIPNAALKSMKILNDAGYEAYLVGGCIRDLLMKRSPKDYDITTNALPEEMKVIFKDYQIIPTGLQHGTMTIIIDKLPLEITTFKSNSNEYIDDKQIKYGRDLKEDLSCRDFTINALAMDINNEIFDYFGGKADIENRIIRCVNSPILRLKEDGLRILRALRFAAVFNFAIDDETSKAIKENKSLLKGMAVERINVELTKLICGKNARQILEQYQDIITVIIPELKPMIGFKQFNKHHCYDVWQHTLIVLENSSATPVMRWSALLHDIGKPECFNKDENGVGHFYQHEIESTRIASEILERLKFDNKSKDIILKLIKNHMDEIIPTKKIVKRRLSKYGEDIFRQILELKKADIMGQAEKYQNRLLEIENVYQIMEEIILAGACLSISDLNINGNDLIELGYQGKEIGEILNNLLDNVIDDRLENDKEELVLFIKEKYNKEGVS